MGQVANSAWSGLGFVRSCGSRILRGRAQNARKMGLWASFSFPSQRRAGSMSKPPYHVLRVVLGFLSLLLAVAGILLIFSSKPLIMRMFMHPPESEISTLLLAAVKEMGGLALALSAMLFFASRDP